MNWKLIEEKPNNWELLQKIIRKCNTDDLSFTVEPCVLEMDHTIVTSFLEMMTEKSTVFGPMWQKHGGIKEDKKTGPQKTKKVKKSQAPSSRKFAIHDQVQKKKMQKEWDAFRLDPKTLYPMACSHLSYRISTFAQLIWWIFSIFPHSLSSHRGTCVDAILSIEKASVYLEKIDTSEDDIKTIWMKLLIMTEEWAKTQWKTWKTDGIHHLFRHPHLMMNCFYDQQRGHVGLYPEQITFMTTILDAVIFDSPLLLGDQRPPGTGKTFMATPLAQKLYALGRQKIVVFTCPNELVRMDVARNALLADDVHLWMGRKAFLEEQDHEGYFIRPHKSCFHTKWKHVYKASDREKKGTLYEQFLFYIDATKRWPNMIVCDLETCLALLQTVELQPHIILMMDEVIFDHPVKQLQVIDILKESPRHTVLMSSILPQWEHVPHYIAHFRQRHGCHPNDDVVRRIEANHHVSISCTIVDPDGYLRMPHHGLEWKHLSLLIQRMKQDPLLGRLFAPQQLYDMISSLDLPGDHQFAFFTYFQRLSDVHHRHVRQYMMDFFTFLLDTHNVPLFEKLQKYRPRVVQTTQETELLTRGFASLEGKTLVVFSNTDFIRHVLSMVTPFLVDAPKLSVLQQIQKKKEQMKENQQKRLLNMKGKDISSSERLQELAELDEINTQFTWPATHVYQSSAHYHRFHIPRRSTFQESRSLNISNDVMNSFDEWNIQLLLSGIGLYEANVMTPHQRMLVMQLFPELGMIVSGKELVFGTNIAKLTNLFISTSFGEHASRGVLYQLIGRIGRMGHSYEARVVTSSWKAIDTIFSWTDEVSTSYTDPIDQHFSG